jgi:uncharacterized phage-associated protein
MPAAMDVARYFLVLVDEESGDSISNLKLQKLLYYAQGFHLAAYDEPLFPEYIEAWAHGPVVPSVYHACKKFGSDTVVLDGDPPMDQFQKRSLELLEEVYSVYGQFSAGSLRNMTHEEPPWKLTAQGGIISHDLMREFFKTRIASEN